MKKTHIWGLAGLLIGTLFGAKLKALVGKI